MIAIGLFDILKTIPQVGDRVFPLVAPQGTDAPYITFQRISSLDTGTMDGTESLDMGRFQIKVFAKTYEESVFIALSDDDNTKSVKTVMSGYGNKVMSMDDYEPDAKLFVQQIDYILSDDVVGAV
ncbi:tail completion protein gp17 [Sulfuricurvum sp.]|uniref:tail completion protein gp17 n=1 Tax=Sulfuricurvum sp. TaxID=2025608 RepID=UPI003BAE5C4F